MNFYSVRELRSNSKGMWTDLAADQEIVITNNGKPSALMINIADNNFDEIIRAVRQAKAVIAFNDMQKTAAKDGCMDDSEIERIISGARRGN